MPYFQNKSVCVLLEQCSVQRSTLLTATESTALGLGPLYLKEYLFCRSAQILSSPTGASSEINLESDKEGEGFLSGSP